MNFLKKQAQAPRNYMVGPKGFSGSRKGVFTDRTLPDGTSMRVLDREVFEGAVRAAVQAKKSA